MQALMFERNGEPQEAVSLGEAVVPQPERGEALVRVHLSPVHPADLHVVRGRFGRQPQLPASPGLECVGIVEALGPDTDGPKLGTRVILVDVRGTWREFIVCPAERLVAVPDAVSDDAAAQAFMNPITAWILTMREHRMAPGEALVQTAAGSTVGRLVQQIGRSEGFRTINLVRRAEQAQEFAALGDTVISTTDDDWRERVVAANGGRAPTKAIDCVAGRLAADVARLLGPSGRLFVFGALSSHRQTTETAFEMPLFAPRMIYAAVSVSGWFLYQWLDETPLSDTKAILVDLLDRIAGGRLSIPASRRYAVSDFRAALLAPQSTGHDGKALLDFRGR